MPEVHRRHGLAHILRMSSLGQNSPMISRLAPMFHGLAVADRSGRRYTPMCYPRSCYWLSRPQPSSHQAAVAGAGGGRSSPASHSPALAMPLPKNKFPSPSGNVAQAVTPDPPTAGPRPARPRQHSQPRAACTRTSPHSPSRPCLHGLRLTRAEAPRQRCHRLHEPIHALLPLVRNRTPVPSRRSRPAATLEGASSSRRREGTGVRSGPRGRSAWMAHEGRWQRGRASARVEPEAVETGVGKGYAARFALHASSAGLRVLPWAGWGVGRTVGGSGVDGLRDVPGARGTCLGTAWQVLESVRPAKPAAASASGDGG